MDMLKKKSEHVIPKKCQLDDAEIQKKRRLDDVNDGNSSKVVKFAKPRTMLCKFPPPKVSTGVRVVRDYPPGCVMAENSVRVNAQKKGLKNKKSAVKTIKQKELERMKAFGLMPEGKVKARPVEDCKLKSSKTQIVGSRSVGKTVVLPDASCDHRQENTMSFESHEEQVRRKNIKEAMIIFEKFNKQLYDENRLKPKKEKIAHWRVPLEAAKLVQKKLKWKDSEKILGRLCGVQVGDTFKYRAQLKMIGLHCQPQGGIDFTMINGKNVALSIVDAHRYSNESGSSDTLSYCGQGGHTFLGDKAPPEDQKLERGNLALKNSIDEKTPVRVIRKVHGKERSKGEVFEYEGLYSVIDFSKKKGEEGNMVFMFKLKRLPLQ